MLLWSQVRWVKPNTHQHNNVNLITMDTRTRFYLVDIDSINCDTPIAHSHEAIDALAESILAVGALLEPLVLVRTGCESYQLISGVLGYYAAVRANEIDPSFETIDAYVIPTDTLEQATQQINIKENNKMLEAKIVTLSRIDYETIEPSEEEVLAYLTLEGSPSPVILIPSRTEGYKQFYECIYGAETLSIAECAECSDCAAYIAENEEQLEALCILLGIELEDEPEEDEPEESDELDDELDDELESEELDEEVVDEIGDLDEPVAPPAPTPKPTPTTPAPEPAPEPNGYMKALADKYNTSVEVLEDTGSFFPNERQRKGSLNGVAQTPQYHLCAIKHIEVNEAHTYTKEQIKNAKAQLLFFCGVSPSLPMVYRTGYNSGTYTYGAVTDNIYLIAAKELYAEKRMEFIGCLVLPNAHAAFTELHPELTQPI